MTGVRAARRRILQVLIAAAGLLALAPLPAADAPGTVLITGANRGIGLEFARQYAALGWRVIATVRRPAEATDLAAIAAAHKAVSIERLDVTDHAGIDALAAKYRGEPLDLLINNAGIAGAMSSQVLGRLDYAAFRQVFETDTVAPLKMTEAFLPNLRAGRQKKVVTLSTSEASFARIDAGRLYWYRASKAAVNMLMLNLAFDLRKQGIAVALINPGPVDTDMMKGVPMKLQPPAEAVAKVIAIIDRLSLANSGRFLDYEGGELPW